MAEIERSIAQKFFDQAHVHPDQVLFHNKEKGQWRAINWGEAARVTSQINNGLMALGLQIGERVSILSENRLEWLYADWGVISAGGNTAAVYPSNLTEEVEYIVNHSEAKWIFVSH